MPTADEQVLPDLSVVIVTHNGCEQALATLANARAAATGVATEWFVVDCGSSDGVADAIESRFGDVHMRRLPNVGFAAGNNAALPLARGRYVLLLNPDVEVRRGTFKHLVATLDDRPEVGCASVVQVDRDGARQPSIRRFPSVRRQLGEALLLHRLPGARTWQEAVLEDEVYERDSHADWLVGAFLIARREAVDAVGLLDERFFLYSEEKDWCLRMHRAGWEVRHLPAMEVVHLTPGYIRPELRAQLTLSKLRFARKHFGRGRVAALRLLLAGGHGIRWGVTRTMAVRRPGMRSRADGEWLSLVAALRETRP